MNNFFFLNERIEAESLPADAKWVIVKQILADSQYPLWKAFQALAHVFPGG